MTRFLFAASAAALTLSASPALSQDWSGGYIGVHGGFGQTNDQDDERLRFDRNLDGNFGDTVTTATGADAFSPGSCGGSANGNTPADGCDDDFDAAEAGIRAGWDFQFGSFVVGAVAEYSGVSAEDSVTSYSTTPASYTFERKLENLAALRARVGYAMGPALFYGTAGGASGEMSNQFFSSNGVNSFDATINDDQADGYQAGGGIEYRLAGNLTVTGEYIYTSLEAPDFNIRVGRGIAAANNPFVLTPNTTGTDITRSNGRFGLHAVRIGMNYRF
ncbi:outer membrane protein [Brevundimonas aurifodinae]|uniref:Outer membrane beta-barrel protein n=2 Tax=Brevundimonas TaxID=41275 RepID=A0ABV1NLJ6_9CAUL|nr:MAG: porin [Brevundimonas sp. 12-68-7]OYX33587.1 MAG: porin [Brevundimonas subvibrioides]